MHAELTTLSLLKNAWLRRAGKWLLSGVLMLIVLTGLTLGGFTLVMARTPAYRSQLQAWLSERAKLDIRFASVRAVWRGYGPELRFTQAEVRSADRQRVLAIAEQGSVGIDLWQAMRTWRVGAARLSLEGTELKVQRLTNGEFELVGQADWPEYESDHAFKLESLPVGELLISKVRISFRDLKTGRGPWVLDQVMLDVRRDIRDGQDVLSLQGSANLPASLGQALTFSAHGSGSLQTVKQLAWQASITGTRLDLAGWAQTIPQWQVLESGVGSFHVAGQFIGIQPQQLSGDVSFDAVRLNLPQWQTPLPLADPLQVRGDDSDAKPLPASSSLPSSSGSAGLALKSAPLIYKRIELAFDARRDVAQGKQASGDQGDQVPGNQIQGDPTQRNQNEWQLQVSKLQLDTDSRSWPAGTAGLKFAFAQEPATAIARVEGQIQHVVLDNLWPLLAFLPDNESNARMRALNVTGGIDQLSFSYARATEDQPVDYSLEANLVNLGAAPVGRWPGLNGLSGSLHTDTSKGELVLNSRNLEFALPRLFRTPLPLDDATGKLSWQRGDEALQIQAQDIRIQNANGRAQANMILNIPKDGTSPMIDFKASGDDLDAGAAPRYMPAGVMQRRTLAWLDNAFPKGRVQHADAILTGELRKYPFRNGGGELLINAHIVGLAMDYQRGYLPASNLVVDAEFRNQGLRATATSGEVNGLKIVQAQGSIADFRDAEARLKANLQGGLDQGLDFVQRSPLGPNIGSLFQQLQGEGRLEAQADMVLPLKNMKQYRVDIDVNLNQARVKLPDVSEAVSNLNGRMHIRNDTVTAAAMRGDFLQGRFSTTTQSVGRAQSGNTSGTQYNIVATGQAQAGGVMRLLKLPGWAQLAGVANYRFTMPGYAARDAQNVRRLYSVDSDLQGMAIALPAPAGKRADGKRALHVEAELQGQDVMQLRGSMDNLRALARLQQSNEHWQFDRAGLRADGISASLPVQPGLRIEGRLDEFTLDDWLKLSSAGSASGSSGGTRVQDVLRSANVTIGKFRLYGFVWPELRSLLQATDAGWRIDAAGTHATGQVLVPYAFDAGKPLVLNMDNLHLQHETSTADGPVDSNGGKNSTLDPRDLPSIQADIRQFKFDEHDFGTLRGTAVRTGNGLAASDLRISGDSFMGNGSGSWLKTSEGLIGALKFTVESSDVRATMQQFNYGDFISGKSGKLIANLSWPGAIDADLLGRSSGSLELQLTDGQLLSVQPGAGRVLGLLSVAALPRRLGLDFRDLTDKGLAYDTIHADFNVVRGDARTQNLTLRGPAVEVGIVGRMGLGVRDYDQTAVVTGDVGNALPVAGTAIGGPVVGAALLLFSKVFKEPLKGVARAYYHIGGSWDDPKVERIESDAAKASLSGNELSSGVAPSGATGNSP